MQEELCVSESTQEKLKQKLMSERTMMMTLELYCFVHEKISFNYVKIRKNCMQHIYLNNDELQGICAHLYEIKQN